MIKSSVSSLHKFHIVFIFTSSFTFIQLVFTISIQKTLNSYTHVRHINRFNHPTKHTYSNMGIMNSNYIRRETSIKFSSKIDTTTSKSRKTSNCTTTKTRQSKNWSGTTTTITGKWREMYLALTQFHSQKGHCRVPFHYKPNPQLGRWVARQRFIYHTTFHSNSDDGNSNNIQFRLSSKLTPERIEALQRLNFEFREIKPALSWNERFDQLCNFRALYGHCRVSLDDDTYAGLGRWVQNQRKYYNILRNGKEQNSSSNKIKDEKTYLHKKLSPERIMALQSIGFIWDTQTQLRDDAWKRNFDELVDFKRVYGHCMVPEKYHDNPTLGIWCDNQRASYKRFLSGDSNYDDDDNDDIDFLVEGDKSSSTKSVNKRDRLNISLDKIAALDKIGFCWTPGFHNWYVMYERLKKYKNERKTQLLESNKHLAKIKDFNEDDLKYEHEFFHIPMDDVKNRDLRLWIAVQRSEYSTFQKNLQETDENPVIKRSSMTPRRIKALEEINFPWNAKSRFTNKNKLFSNSDGPSAEDWSQLFDQMREKGIDAGIKPKEHWFEGDSIFETQEDSNYDLDALWNMEEDDDDD